MKICILLGNDAREIVRTKQILTKEFQVNDLGLLRYFLSIEIARSSKDIFISQCKYILNLLKETKMLGCKLASTPMNSKKKLGT